MTGDVNSPVAILDKEIGKYPFYTIELFELCDRCGARFGIGYHQARANQVFANVQAGQLPEVLREMLRDDHGHDRKHKQFAEIWAYPGPSAVG